MVTCTLPSPSENTPHRISCINLNSGVKISRSMLGFDSENRLFKSHRLQEALAFCHKNVEEWYREVRIAPNLQTSSNINANYQLNKTETNEHRRISRRYFEQNAIKNLEIDESDKQKQIITKEVIEKFPKSKKWYRHFIKLGMKSDHSLERYEHENVEGTERIKSIERYKDMSRLIEDKFGKKSYNPVKKSASFMFTGKPVNLEERPTEANNCPALLKCQSLDTQLYTYDESKLEGGQQKKQERRKSNISDHLSFDFQMCILENEKLMDNEQLLHSIESHSLNDTANFNFDEHRSSGVKLKKSKPDLIPTLPKDDNSYITDRLCSEFHVKTKVQKRSLTKQHLLAERTRCSVRTSDNKSTNLSIFDANAKTDQKNLLQSSNIKKSVVVAQVHEVSKTKLQKKIKMPDIDDIPYSQVVDEIRDTKNKKRPDENIYAEICENTTDTCDSKKMCQCKRTENSEYCYVKLGSNGDSVTQSDSDEAIYNTLR